MKILERIFNPWTKWTVYKSNVPHTRTEVNHITGWETNPTSVMCDIIKKSNKFTGMIKYKTIEKG
tara:strand:+ start:3348 stop:3542 length:195 start_codon:yes stop_codon:yes gene_type:complete